MVGAVEYVVGTDLDDPSSAFLHGSGQIGRSHGVERGAEFLVALCLVHGGIGGTIHDAVDFVLLNELFYGQLVGNVEFLHIGVEPLVFTIFFFEQLHLISELTVATCYQYIHMSIFEF